MSKQTISKSMSSSSKKRLKEYKKNSSELDDDYENRIFGRLEPLEKILLSGKSPVELEEILSKWNIEKSVTPFWKGIYSENMNILDYIANFFYVYLYEKYKYKRAISIILGNTSIPRTKNHTNIKLKNAIVYFSGKIFTDRYFKTKLLTEIENPKIKLIVIPVWVSDQNYNAHSTILMINKFLKTIEYYDPNGYIAYKNPSYFLVQAYYDLKMYIMDMDWYKNGNYDFLSIFDNNLELGIQYYIEKSMEIIPKHLEKEGGGWCTIASLIIVHYRINYYQVDAIVLQRYLLYELTKTNKSMESVKKHILEIFFNYLMYIANKMNNSVLLQRESKDTYNIISKHTKPYSYF